MHFLLLAFNWKDIQPRREIYYDLQRKDKRISNNYYTWNFIFKRVMKLHLFCQRYCLMYLRLITYINFWNQVNLFFKKYAYILKISQSLYFWYKGYLGLKIYIFIVSCKIKLVHIQYIHAYLNFCEIRKYCTYLLYQIQSSSSH